MDTGFKGKEVYLQQKDARKEHEILGIWISPAGTKVEQKKKMTKKVNAWCTQMEESTLVGHPKIG